MEIQNNCLHKKKKAQAMTCDTVKPRDATWSNILSLTYHFNNPHKVTWRLRCIQTIMSQRRKQHRRHTYSRNAEINSAISNEISNFANPLDKFSFLLYLNYHPKSFLLFYKEQLYNTIKCNQIHSDSISWQGVNPTHE